MQQEQPGQNGREWLLQFAVSDRGVIGGFFHDAYRAGAKSPAEIIAWVRRKAAETADGFAAPEAKERARALLDGLRADPDGANELCRAVIVWAQMPPAEREKVKAARSVEYRRAYLATLPTTPKQVAFLQALGYQGPEPDNRLAASDLIDRLRSGRLREVVQ